MVSHSVLPSINVYAFWWTVRYYARSPMSLAGPAGKSSELEPTIAYNIADALIASGEIFVDLLDKSLVMVDDFGLTTGAATMTKRHYWRDFTPVKGSRHCPCGRGRWSACQHCWNALAPVVSVSTPS